MKKVVYAIMFMTGSLYLMSCGGDVEKRVTDLERRVAALEGNGVAQVSPNNNSNSTIKPVSEVTAPPAEKPDGPLPELTFDVTEHDFGTIQEGEVVTKQFTFTNTGEAPLIITNASSSCGCTVPKFMKDTPIAPGETGEIEVKYNSRGKKNQDNKTVRITANTWPTVSKINIKAFVEPKPESETAAGPVKQQLQ